MLNMDFTGIKACMEAKHHVDEEPYEVSLDNYGCCDGPKAGRLRALNDVSSSGKLLKVLSTPFISGIQFMKL